VVSAYSRADQITAMKTKRTTASPLPEPSEPEIQKVAHRLWVEGGCLEGVEKDNWFAAKELLRHHHGRAPTKAHQPAVSEAQT
jgi:hypothetical protein